MFSNLIAYYRLMAGRLLPPVVALDGEIAGIRFGEPKNARNGVSRLYLIKFQSVLPIQEHHPPQCPGI